MRSLILFMIVHIHGGKITKITCFPLELHGKYVTWTYQAIRDHPFFCIIF